MRLYILAIFIVGFANSGSYSQEIPTALMDSKRAVSVFPRAKAIPCASLLTLPVQVLNDVQWLLREYRYKQRVHFPDSVPDDVERIYWKQMHIVEVQYEVTVDWENGTFRHAKYPDESPIPRALTRSEVWAIWETVIKRADFALMVVQGSKNAQTALETLEGRLVACERRYDIRVNRQTGAIVKN